MSFNVKFYVSSLVVVIIKVILQNARFNNKDIYQIYHVINFTLIIHHNDSDVTLKVSSIQA